MASVQIYDHVDALEYMQAHRLAAVMLIFSFFGAASPVCLVTQSQKGSMTCFGCCREDDCQMRVGPPRDKIIIIRLETVIGKYNGFYSELETAWNASLANLKREPLQLNSQTEHIMENNLESKVLGISELKKNPVAAFAAADVEPVAILNRNKFVGYLISATVWKAISDHLDDLELAVLANARLNDGKSTAEVSLDEL